MIYNKILENIVFPLGDKVLHTHFINKLKYWRNVVDKKNANELQKMQKEGLEKLLQHTVNKIPFYKNKNIQLTGDPYADIKQFPIMYKNVIKENIADMYLGNKNKMVVERSSGSSGVQGEVYMTLDENVDYMAIQTYLWEWGGYKMGAPLLQTGITPKRVGIKKMKDMALRTLYVPAFNLSYDVILSNLLDAKKRGCKYFAGYASSLNVYAEVALKENLDIKFEGVISWGDKLFDSYKNTINNAFGSPSIAEVYGTTEGFMMAGLCPQGNHHVLTPHVYLELLDKDGNEVKPGELGFVVVTRLDAYSFPLVRYYLGDMAIKQNENATCSCGKNYPMLQKIVGRDTDIVHTPQGKALIVHFFTYVFEHQPTIQQFRIIQRIPGNIDIEYIPDEGFTPDVLTRISNIICEKAEEVFPIKFIEVKVIPATASGKPQLVLNSVVKKMHDLKQSQNHASAQQNNASQDRDIVRMVNDNTDYRPKSISCK